MSFPGRMGETAGRGKRGQAEGSMDHTSPQDVRGAAILAMALMALVLPARAEPVSLTAEEVTALLTGNTAVGEWSGTPYRQYFAADGTTIYHAEGAPPDTGQWRVNAETGAYESLWRSGGWSGYDVARDGDQYLWIVHGSGDAQTFTVFEGRGLQP